MKRNTRGRGRPIVVNGGTAARASASWRRRAGARPTRPSFASRLQASPKSVGARGEFAPVRARFKTGLRGPERLGLASNCDHVPYVVAERFCFVQPQHWCDDRTPQAALCSADKLNQVRVLLRSKRSARRPSKEAPCERSPKVGSVRVRCPTQKPAQKPVANRAAEGQPCARRGRRARAETKTDTAHPPVWRPS